MTLGSVDNTSQQSHMHNTFGFDFFNSSRDFAIQPDLNQTHYHSCKELGITTFRKEMGRAKQDMRRRCYELTLHPI